MRSKPTSDGDVGKVGNVGKKTPVKKGKRKIDEDGGGVLEPKWLWKLLGVAGKVQNFFGV